MSDRLGQVVALCCLDANAGKTISGLLRLFRSGDGTQQLVKAGRNFGFGHAGGIGGIDKVAAESRAGQQGEKN